VRGVKVVVVGAGIGGLTASVALGRAGAEVTVLERMPQLSEVGAGLTLAPNAMNALETLGLAEAVRGFGSALDYIEHRKANGTVIARWATVKAALKLGNRVTGMIRPALQSLLADALGADALHLGVECVAITQDADGVSVRTSGGGELRGDLAIGADGARSVVRAQFDSTPLRYAGYTTWRGLSHYDGVTPDVHVQTYGRGSIFGIVPVGQGLVYWYGSRNEEAGGHDAPGERKRALLELFRGWHEPVEALIDASKEEEIARADIYDLPRRDRWGDGRVTLLGDAAHPTAPTLGQGACMAIEDGVVFARCLEAATDPAAALRAYEKLRIPRTAWIVRESRRQGRFTQWESPLATRVRDLMLRALPEPLVLRQLAKTARFDP
jgi:2-polyprenyl-6-methoxyphenol hydroxylase-like FAD-dependent oxidoreductase